MGAQSLHLSLIFLCSCLPSGGRIAICIASAEELNLNDPHPPRPNAVEAFNAILPTIKAEVIKSRHHWNIHEPRMWSRAAGISDTDLTAFTIERDLVLVRSAATSYGTIILGKIKIPAIKDAEGEGYIHVRIHDPPNRVINLIIIPNAIADSSGLQGNKDVIFHSLFTEEGDRDADGHPTTWRAIQTAETPLVFFNE
ncbi:hypothetical protein AX17_001432 [Amanita inopinata Kibby_2008]|nr:hypothetical protein AX17_001432 [Amanita inopinata Kibby_2008]